MRILVTGGAGFIGSAVARRLLDRGHHLLLCDSMATGLRANIDSRATFLELGAESPGLVREMKAFGVEAIAHIGGNSSGEIGELAPLNDVQWNVVSTLNLLSAATQLAIKRFVYASSMGVYGKAMGRSILRETDTLEPISIYGVGKVASEQYLKTFSLRGVESVCLRMFNVYGPGQNLANSRQGMVSIYMGQRLNGESIVVKGSLDRVRDFIYIDDVVDAFELALVKGGFPKRFLTLNISTGVGTKVSELLDLIGACAGSIKVEVQGATPGDQDVVVGDRLLAREILGWEPKVGLTQGISHMWNWVSKQ